MPAVTPQHACSPGHPAPTCSPPHPTAYVPSAPLCAAPITAANLLNNFKAGMYNNAPLSVSGVAVLAGSPADGEAGGASGGTAVPAGGARGAPAALPLEILPAGDFEPQYRLPLDVRNGELPVLPLSIYGAGERRAAAEGSGQANGGEALLAYSSPSGLGCMRAA